MKYVDEFNDRKIVGKIASEISALKVSANIMEVCGTHTSSIFRHGIRDLLPSGVRLLTGPGCPVCVTSQSDIDSMIGLCEIEDAVIATFGDMMRVPGSSGSLAAKRAEGAQVRPVYSPTDALEIAVRERDRKVIFLGVGFETTAPAVAATIIAAGEKGLNNFWVYSAHKIMPPAIRAILSADEIRIDGLMLPGHVSTILGPKPYEFINVPSVIAGFEPMDIMLSIHMLLKQIKTGEKPRVGNEYGRAVRPGGNEKAKKVMNEVFETGDAEWRGFGLIPGSGLDIKKKYGRFDAKKAFGAVAVAGGAGKTACICGQILRGLKTPKDCSLFGSACTPDKPVGPCMVSSEGACSTYYKYGAR